MALVFACRHRYPSGFQLDAQFEAEESVTALFGPSGSGKTTVLSLIAGLLRPDEGCIRLGDVTLTDTRLRAFLSPERRRVGLLFQDHCLFPHMNVRRNLKYSLNRGGGKTASFDHVVDVLELKDLLPRSTNTLSGGQQQRVALGRALLRGPDILLLDEPLTAVESSLREQIASFVERVVGEFQIPTLLVSHNRALVDRLAKRVLRIKEGRIVE